MLGVLSLMLNHSNAKSDVHEIGYFVRLNNTRKCSQTSGLHCVDGVETCFLSFLEVP